MASVREVNEYAPVAALGPHTAKLEHVEGLTAIADAELAIKDGSRRVELDCRRNDQHDREADNQKKARQDQVDKAL
jgi:hypothetical protein